MRRPALLRIHALQRLVAEEQGFGSTWVGEALVSSAQHWGVNAVISFFFSLCRVIPRALLRIARANLHSAPSRSAFVAGTSDHRALACPGGNHITPDMSSRRGHRWAGHSLQRVDISLSFSFPPSAGHLRSSWCQVHLWGMMASSFWQTYSDQGVGD